MVLPAIEGLSARAIEAPLAHPIQTASGTVDTVPLVLLDVRTDAEITGQAYIFGYTPAALRPLVALCDELGLMIEREILAPEAVDRELRKKFVLLGTAGLLRMALGGIEMALWDAWCKFLGQPLARVLGGEPRPTQAYDSHAMDGEKLAIERALRSVNQGFHAIKTKIGYADFAEERRVLEALRRELGPDFTIFADYNQSLSVPEALHRSRALLDLNLGWIEEPVLKDDHVGHAEITRSLPTNVQLGENWFGPEDMMLSLRAGAGNLAMVDVMKMGGVSGWMKAAAIAEQFSRPLSSHLFLEISTQLLAVSPTAHWLEWMDIAGGIMIDEPRLEDGKAVPSELPGTGIRFDEEKIAHFLT